MKLFINTNQYIETSEGMDISLPLHTQNSPIAWYCEPIKIWPVNENGYVGKVSEGGSTNFNNIQLNPHGNGTHTEIVGHISEKEYSINQFFKEFHFTAKLISISPTNIYNETFKEDDWVIDKKDLEKHFKNDLKTEALIIRTLPNTTEKKSKNYSHTNPPYFTKEAIEYINNSGVQHLLIDLPSVDRENDKGELIAHKTFWNYPTNPSFTKTITELIFVNDKIKDGAYLLNLQIISLENDASPSKPVLYEIKSV